VLDSIGEDLGLSYEDEEGLLAGLPYERMSAVRALRPEHTCRTTGSG
jgi:beta-lactamase class A